MAAPRLSLATGPWTGSAATHVVAAFETARLVETMHDGCTLDFWSTPLDDAINQIIPYGWDVWVSIGGLPYLRLRIMQPTQDWDQDGDSLVGVQAVGYKNLVNFRTVHDPPPEFVDVDQGEIVWGFVEHTQARTNGDLGITAGSITTGVERTRREYKPGDSIGQRLRELTDVEQGVWWDVDVDLVLTARTKSDFPVRTTDPAVHGTNVERLSRRPFFRFANAAGASGNPLMTVPEFVESAGIATDPRGRWEAFDPSHSSTEQQETVEQHALGLLEESLHPPSEWRLTMELESWFDRGIRYAPGEYVPIVTPRSAIGGAATEAVIQVTEVATAFDENGDITVTVAGVEVAS